MADDTDHAIQVAVRVQSQCNCLSQLDMAKFVAWAQVRPLNDRERHEGFRECVLLDDETKQVVLTVSRTRNQP